MDLNRALKLDALVYPFMFEANRIKFEKLNYYGPLNVAKFTDVKFKVPWNNIAVKKRAITAQRRVPTSTMTIVSLLNGFMGQNEYTTSKPLDEPIPIITHPEQISKINSDQKMIGAAGNTLGDVLWGSKNTISEPLIEQKPTVTPPVVSSKHNKQGYSFNRLLENRNFMNSQQYSLIHPGYDYDDTICKIINQRILCGYNKNLGTIHDESAYTNLKGDCRMRDDRIECGYSVGAQNLNNEPYWNTIYRTRSDQGQGDNIPPLLTKNRGNFDMPGKRAAIHALLQYIRSSNLSNGKAEFQKKYEKEASSPDYSQIPELLKLRVLKSEKISGNIKTTISIDRKNEINYLRVNAEKEELTMTHIDCE